MTDQPSDVVQWWREAEADWFSHDAEFVAELNPNRVLLMPDGVVDYWSDDLLDLVELA